MKISHGKYVGFVDSDDWIDLNFYEVLFNTATKHNLEHRIIMNILIIKQKKNF
jgi:hypothetical protein